MQLQTREQVMEAIRPYRGLEERVFAPTSSYGIRLDGNDGYYQFGNKGDRLPMTDSAWEYMYRAAGLKGSGLEKFRKELVVPLLDESLQMSEKDLKAVIREGEIIAFTPADSQIYDPYVMLRLMERGVGGKSEVTGYQYGGDWLKQYITIVGGQSQRFGQAVAPTGLKKGDVINYGVSAMFTPLGIDLPGQNAPLELGGFTHQLICTNGAVSTQNIMRFTRRDSRQGDRAEWIQEKVGMAYAAGAVEFDRIRALKDIPLSNHTAETLDSTFSQYGIPPRVRGMITRRLINNPAQNMYDLWAHITYVASNFSRVVEDPFLSRRLMTAAGHMVEHHSLCRECHQLLPKTRRINAEVVEAMEAAAEDRRN